MKLQYLGTAAYEGIPALFCECEVCRAARRMGGRDLRTRSQALLDDKLLFDFPADTLCHFQRYGIGWQNIRWCIITHSHSDHLYPEDIGAAGKGYCGSLIRPIKFFSARAGFEEIEKVLNRPGMEGRAKLEEVFPGKEFFAGEYRILPLRANHDSVSSPVVYAVESREKRMLYAHDTGVFPEETWEMLGRFGKFDLVSLDCTGGFQKGWTEGHLCLDTARNVFGRLAYQGLLHADTVRVVNHFSHNGGALYDALSREAEKDKIVVAYDGLEICF